MDTNTPQNNPMPQPVVGSALPSRSKVGKITIIGIILGLAGLVFGAVLIVFSVKAGYEFNNQIYSYWSLSTKAATIQSESQYFDQFVLAIENAHLSGNNALVFKTPDNSYDQNFTALQSAQQRFHQVQSLDPTSFQYSQTLEQIDASGQSTLSVFEGLWYLKNYPFLWGWIKVLDVIAAVLMAYVGFMLVLLSALTHGKKAQ